MMSHSLTSRLQPLRRVALGFGLGLALALPLAAGAQTTVTLLGTAGGPGGMVDRAGVATLVTVGQRRLLVDAGEGVARQLAKAGVSEADLHTVLFTHLHDDHTAGLAGLMTFAWTLRNPKLELIGPPGTRQLLDGALALLAVNAGIRRQENPRLPPPAAVFSAREIVPGEVLAEDGVRITALENTHYHFTPAADGPSHKSYALKIQTADRTVVITGDTGFSDALVAFAKDADLLISEMASQQDIDSVPEFVRKHMLEEHMTAAQVGALAARAGVKQLVLSHIRNVPESDVQVLKRHYGGPVTVGTDLARF